MYLIIQPHEIAINHYVKSLLCHICLRSAEPLGIFISPNLPNKPLSDHLWDHTGLIATIYLHDIVIYIKNGSCKN